MIYRILLFFIGLFFTSMGIMFGVIFLSFLEVGYTFEQYIQYITQRWETLLAPIGALLMLISLFYDKLNPFKTKKQFN